MATFRLFEREGQHYARLGTAQGVGITPEEAIQELALLLDAKLRQKQKECDSWRHECNQLSEALNRQRIGRNEISA